MSDKFILERCENYLNLMSSKRIPYPQVLNLELTSKTEHRSLKYPEPVGYRELAKGDVLDGNLLHYIITSILPYCELLNIRGFGDPLMTPDMLFETLEAAKYFGIPATLTTSAALLSQETIKKLIEAKLKSIYITLDAASEKTHSTLHSDSFKSVVEGINTLIKTREELKVAYPSIMLTMIALKENIAELEQIIALAKSIEIPCLTVQVLLEETEDFKEQSAFVYHRDTAEEIYYRSLIEAELEGFELKISPDNILDILPAANENQSLSTLVISPPDTGGDWVKDCMAPWNEITVRSNGDVYCCPEGKNPLGNISKDSFSAVWYGKSLSKLRNDILVSTENTPDSDCRFRGWRKVSRLKSSVSAGDDMLNYFPGWYRTELEERDFRWCRKKSALLLQRMPSEQFLLMQARRAPLKDAPLKGFLVLNSKERTPFELKSTDWETLEFLLPKIEEPEILQIEIELTHEIRPSEIDENSQDSRFLGMKFSRIWLEDWSKKVVFGQQLVLLGYEMAPETWIPGGDVLFRTFWRVLDQSPENLKLVLKCFPQDDKSSDNSEVHFQSDHLLEYHGSPSSMWVPGMFIAQEHRFPVPENIQPDHYRLELGLYPEGSPKKILEIVRSDRPHDNNRALLGTILISKD